MAPNPFANEDDDIVEEHNTNNENQEASSDEKEVNQTALRYLKDLPNHAEDIPDFLVEESHNNKKEKDSTKSQKSELFKSAFNYSELNPQFDDAQKRDNFNLTSLLNDAHLNHTETMPIIESVDLNSDENKKISSQVRENNADDLSYLIPAPNQQYCNNPDMYASLSQNLYSEPQDGLPQALTNFQNIKERIGEFSTHHDPYEAQTNTARDAEPEAHFKLHKTITHQKLFGHQPPQNVFSQNSFQNQQPFGNPTWGTHSGFGSPKPLPTPQITINKNTNFIHTATPGHNQNIQISQNSGQFGEQFQATKQVNSAIHQNIPFSQQHPIHGIDHHFGRESETVGLPYLINAPRYREAFPRNRRSNKDNTYKVIDMILEKESEMMEQMKKESNREKRSVPLVKLIADPNVKLDMPKTLENLGTITKQSFENKRAPMYHVRNMLGSAKDVVLSALKVAPQDLIIPSQYKIVDKNVFLESPAPTSNKEEGTGGGESDTVGAVKKLSLLDKLKLRRVSLTERMSPEASLKGSRLQSDPIVGDSGDFIDFVGTFQRVGSVIRDSIRSGQDTLKHLGDVAHSARKAFTTARFSAPRVLLPYAKAPAILSRSQFEEDPPDKVMLIAPRILDIKIEDDPSHPADDEEEFVRAGDIMDALGLSNPNEHKVNLTKLVFHHKMPPGSPPVEPRLQLRSNFDSNPNTSRKYFVLADYHSPEENLSQLKETIETLRDAKEVFGTPTIKDFLEKLREDFEAIKSEIKTLKARINSNEPVTIIHPPNTLNNLLNISTKQKKIDIVGKTNEINPEKADHDVEIFLKNLFRNNESLKIKREQSNKTTTEEEIQNNIQENIKDVFGSNNETVGVGLVLPPELFKPFMGRPSKEELNSFLEENGDSIELNDKNKNKTDSSEIVGAINPRMYKKYFNETLRIKNKSITDSTTQLDPVVGATKPEEEVGTSMDIDHKLLKPFLGKLKYGIFYDYEDAYKGSNYQGGGEGNMNYNRNANSEQ